MAARRQKTVDSFFTCPVAQLDDTFDEGEDFRVAQPNVDSGKTLVPTLADPSGNNAELGEDRIGRVVVSQWAPWNV